MHIGMPRLRVPCDEAPRYPQYTIPAFADFAVSPNILGVYICETIVEFGGNVERNLEFNSYRITKFR